MTSTLTPRAVADEFAHAIGARDLEALRRLFAPGATWWHALGDATKSVGESLDFLGTVLGVTTELTYTDIRVTPTATGYVDQHYCDAVLTDGAEVHIPAVMVVTVEKGLITRLDEYLEATAAAPIAAALSNQPRSART